MEKDYSQDSNIEYTITSENTCEVKKGINTDKVEIPSEVIIDGASYKVTGIGKHAFEMAHELVEVTIPSNVTYIDEYAFHYCDKLSIINMNEGLEIIRTKAFDFCPALEVIHFPLSLKTIEPRAFWCENLTDVYISSNTTYKGVVTFGTLKVVMSAFESCPTIKHKKLAPIELREKCTEGNAISCVSSPTSKLSEFVIAGEGPFNRAELGVKAAEIFLKKQTAGFDLLRNPEKLTEAINIYNQVMKENKMVLVTDIKGYFRKGKCDSIWFDTRKEPIRIYVNTVWTNECFNEFYMGVNALLTEII